MLTDLNSEILWMPHKIVSSIAIISVILLSACQSLRNQYIEIFIWLHYICNIIYKE